MFQCIGVLCWRIWYDLHFWEIKRNSIYTKQVLEIGEKWRWRIWQGQFMEIMKKNWNLFQIHWKTIEKFWTKFLKCCDSLFQSLSLLLWKKMNWKVIRWRNWNYLASLFSLSNKKFLWVKLRWCQGKWMELKYTLKVEVTYLGS